MYRFSSYNTEKKHRVYSGGSGGGIISVYFKIIQECIITLCVENTTLLHIKISGI